MNEWLLLLVNVLSIIVTGVTTASLTQFRIKQLECKVDKHNNLIERMVAVEESAKTAHSRINEIRSELHQIIERE